MRARIYNQALTDRFGNELLTLLDDDWDSFEFAVAWVRRSGTERLMYRMKAFLQRAALIEGIVGIDIENTSIEGLEDLISLSEEFPNAKFWVYHNENPKSTFHPKIYLFSSTAKAALIVGSNNMTLAGLFTNTEAGLRVDGRHNERIFLDSRSMLDAWKDNSAGLSKPLTRTLLTELTDEEYVYPEAVLRARRQTNRERAEGTRRRPRRPVFGTSRVSIPRLNNPRSVPSGTDEGILLLARVRRASQTARRTQVQIPIRLRTTGFFAGVTSVTSRTTGDSHLLIEARARNAVNTIKLEMPEIQALQDPVVRFEREGTTVYYTTYDASSPEGQQIMRALEEGRISTVNPTILTLPSDPRRSTWYRFV